MVGQATRQLANEMPSTAVFMNSPVRQQLHCKHLQQQHKSCKAPEGFLKASKTQISVKKTYFKSKTAGNFLEGKNNLAGLSNRIICIKIVCSKRIDQVLIKQL